MFTALFGASSIDEQIERATSENLPSGQEDIALNLEICDQIRCKQIGAKEASGSLRRRLRHSNPIVQLHVLSLIDTCVKNGGNHFLVEVSSREFMDEMVSVLKQPGGLNPQVQLKLLEFIQIWSESFKGRPELAYTCQIYGALKAQGYKFPPKENINPVMIDTQTAPEWTDNDICMRCRSAFTFTNRKHHCRNCGQIFCHSCSSNNIPLPHFGITDPVRVCTGCYFRVKKISVEPTSLSLSEFMASEEPRKTNTESQAPLLTSGSNPPASTETDMDEDLRRAIELSLQESKKTTAPTKVTFSQPLVTSNQEENSEDADLAAAIAASLQDLKVKESNSRSSYPDPSNYSYSEHRSQDHRSNYSAQVDLPNNNLSERETQNIILFSKLIDTIQSTSGYISDPSIHELYSDLGKLVPKLSYNLQDTIQKHQSLLEIQNKLSSAVKLYDSLLDQSINKNYDTGRYSSAGYEGYRSSQNFESQSQVPNQSAPTNYGYSTYPNGLQQGINYNESYANVPAPQTYQPTDVHDKPIRSSNFYHSNPTTNYAPPQPNNPESTYHGAYNPSTPVYPHDQQGAYPQSELYKQNASLAQHGYQAPLHNGAPNGALYSHYPQAGAPSHPNQSNGLYHPHENQYNPHFSAPASSQPPVAEAPLIDL